MEIPHVKTLKEEYFKNNKAKLEKVLEDRKNIRSNWTEEKIKKYCYSIASISFFVRIPSASLLFSILF